jgi:signal transduction histidine kinase
MASNATVDRAVPAAWPVLAALALVVMLSVGSLGVDLYIDNQTADRTAELIDNSLRSITLADDLRYQAYRLSATKLDREQLASIVSQIDVDARAYDPIATDDGEHAEWTRLQALLAHLQHEQPLLESAAGSVLVAQIEASIAHLVEINQRAAHHDEEVIDDAHQKGLWIDVIIGAITLGLLTAVAVVLVRTLRRQRALVKMHIASLGERAKELEAFAARTSHDLKGPLSPLRGYADLLTEHESPQVREVAKRIRRAGDRMNGIVDDLLALSVNGRPLPGKVGVTPVVLELLDEFQTALRDAEVVVALGECTTACSGGVLAQILRNLVSNATKYRAAERRLSLRIEARVIGAQVELVVVDNGVGMDPEVASHAFEPYYRASSTAPGYGLGLSIVKRTVDAIGGICSLSSVRDIGTRVTIRLPAASS